MRLEVGINVADIDSVIEYPCFPSLPSLVQHAGRPACARGRHSDAIIYIKKTDVEAAMDFVQSEEYIEDLASVSQILMGSQMWMPLMIG